MQQRWRLLFTCLSWITFIGQASAAHPISETHARTLFPAVAKVILQRDTTTGLLSVCARRFASLKQESQRAGKTWLKRNRAILDKATDLRNRLWQSLKQQQSGFKAETFNLNIDRLMHKNVQKKIHSLDNYSRAQQHAVCNHLVLAVRAGDWDVSRKQPHAYSILQKFR